MNWDVDWAHGYLWACFEAAVPLVDTMKQWVGICFTQHRVYFEGTKFAWCTLDKENEQIGMYLVEKFNDVQFTKTFVAKVQRFYAEACAQLDALDLLDASTLNDKELFKAFSQAIMLYRENFSWGFIFEPIDPVLLRLVQKALHTDGFTHEQIADLLVPADTSFTNQE